MTVPAGATVSALVNAEGDIFASIGTGNQALVELHLVIDGAVVRTVRASSTNLNVNSMPSPWHLGIIKSLGAGSHEFHVEAEIIVPFSLTPTVTANVTPGNLSVALLRQ
jgi:ornithine cyclodeaminase/alanine dehydrogenase-like protein (mu-crystallin family)